MSLYEGMFSVTFSYSQLKSIPAGYSLLLSGQISLMGTPPNLGGLITKGNVYLDGSPICDLGWSHEDATVACRFTILCFLTVYSPGCWDTGKGSLKWAPPMDWL